MVGHRKIVKYLNTRITEEYSERFDMMLNKWIIQDGEKTNYYLDSGQRIIGKTFFNFENGKWEKKDSVEYGYNQQGVNTYWIEYKKSSTEKTELIYTIGITHPTGGYVFVLDSITWKKQYMYTDIIWGEWSGIAHDSEILQYIAKSYDASSNTYTNMSKMTNTMIPNGLEQVEFNWNKQYSKWDSSSVRIEQRSDTMSYKKKMEKSNGIWKTVENSRWSKQPDKEFRSQEYVDDNDQHQANYGHTLYDEHRNVTETLQKRYENSKWITQQWQQFSYTYQSGTSKLLTKTRSELDPMQNKLVLKERHTYLYNLDKLAETLEKNNSISPSIFSKQIEISLKMPSKIEIYDLNGKTVYKKFENNLQTTLSLSFLPKGCYIVNILNSNTAARFKIKITKQTL